MNQLLIERPWEKEPNRVELEILEYPCLIIRHEQLKHLCGYVAVQENHPLFGKHYENININVHGGLTYSDEGNEEIYKDKFFYKPKYDKKSNKLWWFGFDCAHAYDYVPGMYEQILNYYIQQEKIELFDCIEGQDYTKEQLEEFVKEKYKYHLQLFEPNENKPYRDIHYVKKELIRLVQQLNELSNKH